jgi:Tfp pilus assembly protein PilO
MSIRIILISLKDMANTKSEKKNIILAIILSAIIISALVWLTFFYQIGKISKMSEDVQKEKLDFYVQQEKSDKLLKLKKELVDVEGRQKEMEAMLPDKDNVVPILRSLESIAAETSNSIKITSVNLNKIKIGQEKKVSAADKDDDTTEKNADNQPESAKKQTKSDDLAKLKDYPAFDMEITGTFPAIVDFTSKMENLPYFVRVLKLDAVPYVKPAKQVSANETVLPGSSVASGSDQLELAGSKGVKLSLLVVIYINDKK